MSFVFYDVETSGLSPQFDQIISFAAIRTDASLNEIERIDLRSRLLPYVVPDPGALAVNGEDITQLLSLDRPTHYEMMREIDRTFRRWSPAIFVGHNSLGFDEQMLHHAFYQTLHPPYLTSLHNNGRADSMSLLMATMATSPGTLAQATGANGAPSYRLRDVALANGVAHRQAHNAMSDAETTLELCRLVQSRCPDAWSRWNRFSRKSAVIDFLSNEGPCLLTEFYANQAYHTPVVCIGVSTASQNEYLCLSLNADIAALASVNDETLRTLLLQRPSPIRRIKVNACPVLTPLYDVDLDAANIDDESALQEKAYVILEDVPLRARLVAAYCATRSPYLSGLCVETRLYGGGFIDRANEAIMDRFHNASWSERLAIAMTFTDDRLRCLALRLIHFHDPTLLDQRNAAEVWANIAERSGANGGALDREGALEKTRAMIAENPALNASLGSYLHHLLSSTPQ